MVKSSEIAGHLRIAKYKVRMIRKIERLVTPTGVGSQEDLVSGASPDNAFRLAKHSNQRL
jgi:hypothetical protein